MRLVEGQRSAMTVAAPLTVRLELPSAPWSVRLARHAVGELIDTCDGVDDVRREHALLIVTEIVTNAVEHVGGTAPVTLDMMMTGDRWLHASVADVSPGPPVLRPFGADGRGWGMRIVDGLAARWGVEYQSSGKRVWFEIPL